MTSDIAKLILRVSVGIMILFHGFDKVINGIDGIKQLTVSAGFLEFLAYSVFIGEVIVPIFILLGAYARAASLVLHTAMQCFYWASTVLPYLNFRFCILLCRF